MAIITAVSLLFLSSCATNSSGGEEKEMVSVEKEMAAMELLSFDMFSSLSSFSFEPEILSDALPSSFTLYKEYVPSYNDLEKKYLTDVASVAIDAVDSYVPVIKERALEMSGEPTKYISGDTTFSDALKTRMGEELSSVIYNTLSDNSSLLDESFLSIARIFDEIRKGYASLKSVGKEENLPKVESILLKTASTIVSDEFFRQLGKKEKILKNTPVSSDSPYSVFWE